MLNFKTFLLEYLNPDQREHYSRFRLTAKARRDTDHFFGSGNDKIHGQIEHDDKSEIHNRLEQHLGRSLSHDEYNTGITKDKYGRDVKLGRMIKDHDLRNQFDHDVARKTGYKPFFKTTTVRGIEVAGQTNPEPNAEHPKGHSWPGSCKNITKGINKHYLPNEIKHGTVVHFVHDHNGQEIYRATLQPHHNDKNRVAYALDSEYGIKHPKFTADAHRIAKELSGRAYGWPIHEKHGDVYNDNEKDFILHPNASDKQISKVITDGDHHDIHALLDYKDLSSKHLMSLIKDPDIREEALKHPNINTDHLEHIFKDKSSNVYDITAAAKHSKATPDQLRSLYKSSIDYRIHDGIASNPNIPSDLIDKIQAKTKSTDNPSLRARVAKNKNLNSEQLEKAVNDSKGLVRGNAALNPILKPHHIDKLVNDEDEFVKESISKHPNILPHHIDKLIDAKNSYITANLVRNKNFNSEHVNRIVQDHHNHIFGGSILNDLGDKLKSEHLTQLSDNENWGVRHSVAKHPSTPIDIVKKLSSDKDHDVRIAARERLSNEKI